jgi:ATP-dependent DNA helicase DinG
LASGAPPEPPGAAPRAPDGAPEAWLGPDGPVAAALRARGEPYEARAPQLRMAEAVERALSSGRHLVVEAGTGVGKSFAYLVPALAWAARTGRKVAVATATIALQEQLVRRDLPLLASALPFEIRTALVKGRGNYLCLRRMHAALADRPLFEDDARRQLEAIGEWSKAPGEGSRQALGFQPLEVVWDLVKAEHGNCLGRACSHYARCPYQASRARAHAADLLVLNHHVLLSDLALRRSGVSFLPKVDAVIVDEAHDLEEIAAEHLGARASSIGLLQALGRLWNPRTRQGLLARHPDAALRVAVEEARIEAQAFFDGLQAGLRGQGGAGGSQGLAGARALPALAFPDPSPVPETLVQRLAALAGALEARREALVDRDAALELGARGRSLGAAAEALATLGGPAPDGTVRWVDLGARHVTLCAAPVDVGPLLREALWNEVHPAILTSATLATGRPPSFEFLRKRLGLDDADELALGSPYDFQRQAKVVLRRDLPDPSRAGEAWEAALPDAIEEAVRESRGGALVLFTSVASMRRAAEALRPRFAEAGLELLVQGEELERAELIERLRAGGGVLLGVASFWQGVDVPGEALRHVVIVKLPFEVPTHPLHAARSARVEAEGGDAFQDLALPQAALKLKQGFGRLIRRATDQGRVTILDPRMLTKGYGRFLLASLPSCPVEVRGAEDDPASPPDPWEPA